MRAEKKFISAEYVNRLNASPFFLVVDYRGLSVGQFTELRKRLTKAGAELHVVKNTIFRISAKTAGLADLSGVLSGQLAVVTGKRDIAAASKAIKTFQAEFEKPKLQFGYLGSQQLSAKELAQIADLPPLEVLQGKLLGVINAPAQRLASILGVPASQLARVIKAHSEKA
jgi:large subunit ribosomal protein L10